MAVKLTNINTATNKFFEEYEDIIKNNNIFDQTSIAQTKNTSPKVKYIPRNNGSTNWILKGAIINENVIIVCKDGICKRDLQNKYLQMKRQFYLEMSCPLPPIGPYPKFLTINEYEIGIRGHRVPIVFDNSCFF